MRVLDLFSGIGGFSLGLERAGMKTVAFCEYDKHAQKVLRKHWPDVPIFEDVRKLDGNQFRGSVDVVCGGFPCQDVSVAGKQAGFGGERSNLYTEMLRVIGECRPKFAIFENVSGLLTGDEGKWFGKFLYDLAEIGFDAEWHCISASYIGAPHHRDRVWIVAYPSSDNGYASENEESGKRLNQSSFVDACESTSISSNADDQRRKGRGKKSVSRKLDLSIKLKRSIEDIRRGFDLSEPPLCGANDGVSGRAHRLKQLGNAVVPVIPEAIGRAIMSI